jgi:hypothetical protein
VTLSTDTPDVGLALYGGGTTFFTLGLGDVLPHARIGHVVVVLEAGTGFAFLALIISHVPLLYQQFSSRAVNVPLLDVRTGSPRPRSSRFAATPTRTSRRRSASS